LTGVFPKRGTAVAKEKLANFSDEMTEGRRRVRAEDESFEHGGWIVSS